MYRGVFLPHNRFLQLPIFEKMGIAVVGAFVVVIELYGLAFYFGVDLNYKMNKAAQACFLKSTDPRAIKILLSQDEYNQILLKTRN